MITKNLAVLLLTTVVSVAANVDGPFNGMFIPAGKGLSKPMASGALPAWTISCWLDWSRSQPGTVLLGGFGDPAGEYRFLALRDGKLAFATSASDSIVSDTAITPNQLTLVAASYDGARLRLYADHVQVAEFNRTLGPVKAEMNLAPYVPGTPHFSGRLAHFQISSSTDLPSEPAPNMDLINFEVGSETWRFQTRQEAGYFAPQAPSTLPTSAAEFSKPVAIPPYSGPDLVPTRDREAIIAGNWKLAAAPTVQATVEQLSDPGFDARNWYAATVPGTVLTTLIDRGVYPDPAYGLNNLAIPESLNKQDYWYRAQFTPTAYAPDERVSLTFNGTNYLAKVWLNGKYLGQIKGAFVRGIFDVTGIIQGGKPNVLLVRISPPPNPGFPQEQSIKAGPGDNGGMLCLDGPTFVATEGWDWIPGIRDRNSGIWQDVRLNVTKAVSIGDAQVITRLPLPETSSAQIVIKVPVHNSAAATVAGTLHADFEGVSITKALTLPPGDTVVTLAPTEFPQLQVNSPRLWWPNGYGKQELYHLQLSFETSDQKSFRFGIRDISYELSLLDKTGDLKRVEIAPAHATNSEPIIDVRHEAIVHTNRGWVYSLKPEAETSPAVSELSDTQLTPYLVIKVNGVRIAARGGSWGMDDYRKRVSRQHLEPFFKLHHDANINIIRNWVGQDTEETFYELADEYGLLVFNDFWQSTQNDNAEPTDTALFLENARDTITRFRNHPSILVWCGRNEGVPAPALNVALDELIRTTDGTRIYAPSSNTINLQDSGPYRYFEPSKYFTEFDRGFAVEVGIPSFPTLDSFRSFIPKSEQWPITDTWAYHDWHQSGNGVMGPFMAALAEHYGAPTSLEDFEKKAQLMNYIGHRAIFEGMNARLWTANSGRMLWMTQPAWPSTVWQILSFDYDTQASYYGVKKAAESIHIQMNLPDLKVAVINNTTKPLTGIVAKARIFDLQGRLLSTHQTLINAAAASVTEVNDSSLALGEGLTFIRLDLTDGTGHELSQNFYWYANKISDYAEVNQLPPASLKVAAASSGTGSVMVTLENSGKTVSFMNKLTLRNASDGSRVLPAYYADNYISLLPGEKRTIQVDYPSEMARGSVQIGVSGWSQTPFIVAVGGR